MHLAQFHPGILVIDSNLLDEEIDALIGAVKAKQPAIRCLVLLKSSPAGNAAAGSGRRPLSRIVTVPHSSCRLNWPGWRKRRESLRRDGMLEREN